MKLHPLRGRRLLPLLYCSLAAAWFGVACGNDGSAGDGVTTDDGSSRAGTLGLAGMNAQKAGMANASGGRNGTGGTSANGGAPGTGGSLSTGGTTGTGGTPGTSGGSAGRGGSSGTPGTGGSATTAGSGGRATGGTGTGGSAVGGSSGGNTTTGGSNSTGGTSAVGGQSTGVGGMVVSLTCGNGIVETGEQCDDAPKSGGAGGIDGSGGGTAVKDGQLCSNGCYKVGTPTCVDCELAGDCYESIDACLGPEDKPFTAQQRSQCYAVMHCVQATNCFDGTGALGASCYCGPELKDTGACSAAPFTGPGSPSGPCKAEFQAGMSDLNSNSGVLGNLLSDNARPTSAALVRLTCQKNDKACTATCGFSSSTPFPPLP